MNHYVKLFYRVFALALIAVAISAADAAPKNWTNTVSGSWEDATNWNPATAPDSTDGINLATGSVTVNVNNVTADTGSSATWLTVNTIEAGVSGALMHINYTNTTKELHTLSGVSDSVLFRNGGNFLMDNGILRLDGGFRVGDNGAVSASTATITGGRLVLTNAGLQSSTFGNLLISGGQHQANTLSVDFGGTATISGGTTAIRTTFEIGGSTTGTLTMNGGALTVTNGTTTLANNGIGTLVISNGIIQTRKIRMGDGAAGAVGDLKLYGGTATVNEDMIMGVVSGSTGRVLVAGGTLNVTNDVSYVGFNGKGFLTISNGTYNAKHIAVNSNGSGTMEGGTLNITTTFQVNPSGQFVLNGGTINTKGSLVNNATVFVVGNGTSAATLNLETGGHSFADGISVANNGTLKGTGTLAESVTVSNGGNFTPGASPGTLTVNNLTLNPSALLNYELGPHNPDGSAIVGGGTNDLGVVTGNLILDGVLNLTALDGFGAFGSGASGTNVYRLFNYSGSLTDNGLTIGTFPTYAVGFIDLTTPGQVNLFVIPEPSVVALSGIACAALLWRRRKE